MRIRLILSVVVASLAMLYPAGAQTTPGQITLTASPNPSTFGAPVTLTAMVRAPWQGARRVTFYDGATILGNTGLPVRVPDPPGSSDTTFSVSITTRLLSAGHITPISYPRQPGYGRLHTWSA